MILRLLRASHWIAHRGCAAIVGLYYPFWDSLPALLPCHPCTTPLRKADPLFAPPAPQQARGRCRCRCGAWYRGSASIVSLLPYHQWSLLSRQVHIPPPLLGNLCPTLAGCLHYTVAFLQPPKALLPPTFGPATPPSPP